MCKLLVNRGANFQIVDNNKETPVIYARKKKNRSIVEYFNALKNSIKQREVLSRMVEIILYRKVVNLNQKGKEKRNNC